MPVVFACIAPHGFPIIPDLSDDAEGGMTTRSAMEELGRRCQAASPDVIVIAGPHGVRVDGSICLGNVSRAAGSLEWKGRSVELNVPVDAKMTDAVAAAATLRGVPIALAGYAGNRREQSRLPLDWGLLTPLWFLGNGRNMAGHGSVLSPVPTEDFAPPVVIATPSRALPRQMMVTFGQAVADAADADGRRVAFVASCDWAHTHRSDGPYGFHEAAERVDAVVVNAIESEDLGSLLDLAEDDVTNAAIDGLWQTLMLHGVLQSAPMGVELLSYEAPRYYGMIVAAYESH